MKKTYLKQLLCLTAAACLAFSGCKTDVTAIENDIDNLKEKVSELEKAVNELQHAYEQGKIITNIQSIDSAEIGGGGIRLPFPTAVRLRSAMAKTAKTVTPA